MSCSTAHVGTRKPRRCATRSPGYPIGRICGCFLDTAFGAAERGGALTVVLFDIDHFKAVNDQHGHPAGDETLRVFADILEVQTRRSDLTARFGGEEFLSVLTGPGAAAGARIFAERVRGSLHDAALPWGPIAASAGIAQYHDSIASPDILLAEVDRALYHAKGTGRDRVVASSEIPPATEPQPVADASVGPTPSPAERGRPSRVPGAPSHILIVEDDTFMREGLSRILRRSGFHTSMAEDGAAALAHLESDGVPDLILSDLVMPGMGGLTLADRAHQLCPGIRILLVSGYEHDRVMDNVPESVCRVPEEAPYSQGVGRLLPRARAGAKRRADRRAKTTGWRARSSSRRHHAKAPGPRAPRRPHGARPPATRPAPYVCRGASRSCTTPFRRLCTRIFASRPRLPGPP